MGFIESFGPAQFRLVRPPFEVASAMKEYVQSIRNPDYRMVMAILRLYEQVSEDTGIGNLSGRIPSIKREGIAQVLLTYSVSPAFTLFGGSAEKHHDLVGETVRDLNLRAQAFH